MLGIESGIVEEEDLNTNPSEIIPEAGVTKCVLTNLVREFNLEFLKDGGEGEKAWKEASVVVGMHPDEPTEVSLTLNLTLTLILILILIW